jgi:hypothetical protein
METVQMNRTIPADILRAMRAAFESSLADDAMPDPADDAGQEPIGACGCYRTLPSPDSDGG